MGIAFDRLPVELDPFVNKKLFDDRLALIARRGHPSVKLGVTLEDLRKAEFVLTHRRRDIEHLPNALRLSEAMHVSELLEIPTVVASTNLLGIMPPSMGPLMQKRLGLQVLAIPIELPPGPIYMIWHESRRNDAGYRWLRDVVMAKLGHSSIE